MFFTIIPIITEFLILSFYCVIFSWIIAFFFGSLSGLVFEQSFFSRISSGRSTILFSLLGIGFTALIVSRGVHRGIEKANMVMMPLLFLLLIIMAIRSVTLPGASEGISFYLRPDFSKLTATVWLMALSQLFFFMTLSGGPMVVYGGYQQHHRDLTLSSILTAVCDVSIVLIAGFVIFPAVFSFGLEPAAGQDLIFLTLPKVFFSMPHGNILSILFFFLLILASLTTTVAQLEVCVNALCAHTKLSRKRSTLLAAAAIFVFSAAIALSGDLFAIIEYISTVYLAMFGAILASIALMWFHGSEKAREELNSGGKIAFGRWWGVMAKYVYSIVLVVILMTSI